MNSTTAFQKYQCVMWYLQSEGQLYWTRSQLYLVASAALLGLVGTHVPPFSDDVPWVHVVVDALAGLAGLGLCALWRGMLDAGDFSIHRWRAVLVALEPEAMGDTQIWRSTARIPVGTERPSARKVIRTTVKMFASLWVIVLVYTFCVAIYRLV